MDGIFDDVRIIELCESFVFKNVLVRLTHKVASCGKNGRIAVSLLSNRCAITVPTNATAKVMTLRSKRKSLRRDILKNILSRDVVNLIYL